MKRGADMEVRDAEGVSLLSRGIQFLALSGNKRNAIDLSTNKGAIKGIETLLKLGVDVEGLPMEQRPFPSTAFQAKWQATVSANSTSTRILSLLPPV